MLELKKYAGGSLPPTSEVNKSPRDLYTVRAGVHPSFIGRVLWRGLLTKLTRLGILLGVATCTQYARRSRSNDASRVGFYVSLIRVIVINLLLLTLAWSMLEFTVTRSYPHKGILSENTINPVIFYWGVRGLCYLAVIFLVAIVTASLLDTASDTCLTISSSRISLCLPLISHAYLSLEEASHLKRMSLCRAYPRAPPV